MIKRKNTRLMRLDIVHQLPGRMRLRSRSFTFLRAVETEMLEALQDHKAIHQLDYQPITGSLLIIYDHMLLDSQDLYAFVEDQMATFSLMAYQAEREASNTLTVNERRLQEEPAEHLLKRVLVSGISLIAFGLFKSLPGMKAASLGHQYWHRRLFTPPALISVGLSVPIFKSGWHSLATTRRPNADTLTASAILTALLTGRSLSALVTILLADIAEFMTAYTMEKTRKAIGDMLQAGDETVFIVTPENTLVKKKSSQLLPGDIISVQSGDKIAADGEISEGEGFVDESPITGEFFPAEKRPGQRVFAGTLVKSGNLRICAEQVGNDTTVARIVHMVESAAGRKAAIQTFADRFSAHLIPMNFALAILIYGLTRNINRALSMMIIDFSCGVRLSTATALSACIHNAARNGVLIKGGNYVEALAEADSLILDKTGTVTEGRPRVVSLHPTAPFTQNDIIQMASAAEEDSSHPLAHAILDYARLNGIVIPTHGMTEVVTGRGVRTTIQEDEILVGNRKYLKENGVDISELQNAIHSLEQKGEMIIYVAKNKLLAGVIGVHDALKENMKKSLNRLRHLGIDDIRLLTGDIAFQAEKVAKRMHMDDFGAELMPEDKVRTLLSMQGSGSRVIMIGDGINDAPALAYADVGIAIGNTRTDVAIESSNVTITNDDPLLIPSAIQLSRRTMETVRNNFRMAVGLNALGIILSAMGWLPVVWGSVLHNSSTILVVMNSGRLLIHDFERRTFE